MRRLAAALGMVAVAGLMGCRPVVVWRGFGPNRDRDVEVVEKGGDQWVVLDGQKHKSYDGIAVEAITFDASGHHLAYAAETGQGWIVVVDGRESGPWDGVAEITFSPDGLHVAYAAQQGDSWRVVLDNRGQAVHGSVLAGSLTFSPDSGRLAYVAQDGDCAVVVVDGTAGACVNVVADLTFSHDSRHLAYVARDDRNAQLVVDGVLAESWDAIAQLVAHPAGGFAFYARQGEAWRVVSNGRAGPAFDDVRQLVLSRDGARLAYVGRRGAEECVVSDDREPRCFAAVHALSVQLSADGQRLAYVANQAGRTYAVLDGVLSEPFDEIIDLRLGHRDGHYGFLGRRDGQWTVVIDGLPRKSYAWASDLNLSPNGDRWAVLAYRQPLTLVVVDGDEQSFDLLLQGSLAFDARGYHWAVIAGDPKRQALFLIVDGVPVRSLSVELTLAAMEPDLAALLSGVDPVGGLGTWVRSQMDEVVLRLSEGQPRLATLPIGRLLAWRIGSAALVGAGRSPEVAASELERVDGTLPHDGPD